MRAVVLLRRALVTAAAAGALLVPASAFAQGSEHGGLPDGAGRQPVATTTSPHEGAVPEGPAAGGPDDPVATNPYFLAAGGAMTAAGAAGLVYSTVRRGRADR
ncbi:hypothetical protein GTW43_29365 [Streptomyces sp. SID5785]|uniref:hypothetical protein n=1 Tax=Streptomyces sp. SID5785 TaxID=2690309 RepID=UPI001360D747|nr:hypothetical protein [Streptomyces sp. SID5785]MZD09158.1 hypothetical protein [Streptomyces sp. SID5785]